MATDGILVRVLGDYGPFSTMGKSIGYQVTIGDSSFLVDCGSPLFQQIGGSGIKTIRGLIITHCHDDHKRWFTDLALFNLYAPEIQHRLPVFTSTEINEQLRTSAGAALNSSLSGDSRRVVDLDYDDYIDFTPLAPSPLYCVVRRNTTTAGASQYAVVDQLGNVLGPERAKIVISARNGVARLLFKDPVYDEWVEPEQFYPFSSRIFYGDNLNVHHDPAGFTIEAINAPVWHGMASIGLKFSTAGETLIFSGDTCHDTELWRHLRDEKREQRLAGSREEFEAATVLYGDINDYIERSWSRERYEEAVSAFDGATVIHDIALRGSVVHTDYSRLKHTALTRERTILTHSPDRLVSEWVLSRAEKTFLIRGNEFSELVGDLSRPMDAAIYQKHDGRYYVGYRNPEGGVAVFERDGLLSLGEPGEQDKGTHLYRVDIYEDVGGKYLPKLAVGDVATYVERPDGRVERLVYNENGSRGDVVTDLRGTLVNR